MKRFLSPISLAALCVLVQPLLAQNTRTEVDSSVVRIKECQITLAAERLLASGQGGIISAVHVREGDYVRQGQLLAELDDSVPKASLAIAEKQAENDVNVRFAKAAALVARADYNSSRQANERQRGSVSSMEMHKLELERNRSILGIEVAEHELLINQLRRDEAAALVASYRIVAPMNGIVSRVFKSSGEAVQVGESVLQCQSTDKVHVEADVDIQLLQLVTKGRHVRVIPTTPHPSAAPDNVAFDGKVFFVGVYADLGTSTVRVLIEVDNREGLLLAGTDAVVEINPTAVVARSTAIPSGLNQRD